MRNKFRAKPRARRGVGFHLLVIGRSECDIGHGKDHPGLAVTRTTPEEGGSLERVGGGSDDGNEFAAEKKRRRGFFSPTITLNDIGVYFAVEYDCASLRGEDPPLPPPFRETRPPQHHFAGLLCLVEPPCLRKYNSGSINSLSIRIDE